MKQLWKKYVVVICMFACSMWMAVPVSADTVCENSREAVNQVRNADTARAENVGYKYKVINNKLYKRLWSYTRNQWVDSKWTPV